MVEQRKPVNWRVLAIFASGLLLGGVAAAWAVMTMRAPGTQEPAPQIAKATGLAKPDAPAPKAAAVVATAHAACPAAPVVAAADRDDGQAKPQGEPAAMILAGKEAAAAGRPRDAELSFLAACRAADKHAGSSDSIDARYQLARHYANLVLVANTQGASRTEMVKRADVLYSDAVQAYRARHGESHEKTRFAADGLAALRQSVGRPAVAVAAAPVAPAAPAASAKTAKPAVVASPAPAPAKAVVAAAPVVPAPAPAPPPKPKTVVVAAPPPPPRPAPVQVVTAPVKQATGAPTQGRPSFDCALARSPAERRICGDAELSRLDRDLGRLHARARDAAPDSAAFRRQNDREWRRRETNCGGDRDCLLDWYANRRDQLLEDLNE